MTTFFATMLLIVTPVLPGTAGGVDLSQSSVSSSLEEVPAGTVVTVNVVLKNSGAMASTGSDVRIRFPRNGFLVRIDELPQLRRDDDEREVTAVVDIPAEGEYRFSYDLLASRKEAHNRLSSDIEVRNYQADARLDTEFSIRIGRVPSTAGVIIGGLRFHPAAFWLLGWVVASGLFFVTLRSRVRWIAEHPKSKALPARLRQFSASGLVAVIMIPAAFLMVGAGLAWHDLQCLTNWQEAQATILDRRDVIQTESQQGAGNRRRTSVTHTPEFALKYQAGQREVISSGFDTGTSLRVGGQVMGKAEMDGWVVGKSTPCWFDPADPANVVVRRGFGGAYIFYLIPLPILWFGVSQLRKVGQAVRRLVELELSGS